MKTRTYFLDGFLIFALTAALIWPLFKTKYLTSWGSIESTFIADGRFLNQHWPHPNWQPLWYCGTRFDYVYPPALRYGTAGLAKLFPIIPARAYHLYIAILYCTGILGVYLLMRIGSGSRLGAWLAAAATALVSPSFLFFRDIRWDVRVIHMAPHRLNVLVRYGEGPHMSALALLPIALAAAFLGLQGKRPAALALSALFSALVVSNNFYGATMLALLFPLLAWGMWVTHQDARVWLRAAAIAVLAHGLTACWLTPSYVWITRRNLVLVAEPGNTWSLALALALAAAFVAVTWKLARGKPQHAWSIFVWGALLFIGLNVLGHHYFKFRVSGEPLRLVPELDLVMILAVVEGLRWLWKHAPAWWRPGIVIVALGCFLPARSYLVNAHQIYKRDPKFNERIEYRITEWVAQHLAGARCLATGSVRFWYNAWFDLPQLGGGSEQGTLNLATYSAQWELAMGSSPQLGILWLQSLGVDAAIAHDKNSQEVYHDYVYAHKYDGYLPVIYDNRQGDKIYRVPRRFPDRARVVETGRLRHVQTIDMYSQDPDLPGYVDAIERGPDAPARLTREGPDAMRIHARLGPGQSIVVQESYDPAWRAYAGSRPVAVRKDPIGFLWIDAPPGEQELRLVFETPLENRVGQAVSVLALLGVVGLVAAGAWRRRR